MSDDFVTKWGDIVNRIANSVARDFPDIERDDVAQYLYMLILEQKFEDPTLIWMFKVLSRAANIYAWDQRKEHLQLSPQYSYRTRDVKAILASLFDRQDWESVKVPDDAKSEFNDVFLEINCDVKGAWMKLGYAQKRAIFEKYALGFEPKDEAAQKRLYRAVAALTDNLNWYQKNRGEDYVGSRRVITNANARANISHLED